MRRRAEIPEVLIAHAVPRLVRELTSSAFVADAGGVDRGKALISTNGAVLGALAGEDVVVNLEADPWAQKWATGDILDLWGRAESAHDGVAASVLSVLVWPVYRAGGSWTEDPEVRTQETDVNSEEAPTWPSS